MGVLSIIVSLEEDVGTMYLLTLVVSIMPMGPFVVLSVQSGVVLGQCVEL